MYTTINQIKDSLFKQVSIAPLIVFRVVFGGLLLFSTIRTAQQGWIYELYIEPTFHFGFFSWLTPLSENGMYLVFALMGIAALGIMLGLFYRISTILFFLLFTYVELLDKTYYLNHYYLVCLMTFWLCLVPAHRSYSIDSIMFPNIRSSNCSNWHLLIFKVQLSVVYFFAGLAKVNSDWLFHAQPLATWLPGRYQLPVIGSFLHYKELAFLFSWIGCIYDLSIWVFLWIKRTRGVAYVFVLIFHFLTAVLFPRIGMFPFIMITCTIIFFSTEWHQKVLSFLPFYQKSDSSHCFAPSTKWHSLISIALIAYFIVQLYLPFRYIQYPGNLFWHEQGYRFSWRVMLMEKNGYTSIILKDPKTKLQKEIDQNEFLTAFQKQQMRSQPDMILQFAKHIGDEFYALNGYAPEIYVESYLSLNGRRSQVFTDKTMDVYSLKDPLNSNWIIPLKEK